MKRARRREEGHRLARIRPTRAPPLHKAVLVVQEDSPYPITEKRGGWRQFQAVAHKKNGACYKGYSYPAMIETQPSPRPWDDGTKYMYIRPLNASDILDG